MRKYKNLLEGEKKAYESGEYLWIWLNELRSTCRNDKVFKREIDKMFENSEGVYEYWEKNKDNHQEWNTWLRNSYSRE